MKKSIPYILGLSLLVLGLQAANHYGPTVFYGDVSTGSLTNAPTPMAIEATVSGGSYTNGTYTNYYRLAGTNLLGRIASSTNLVVSWTGAAESNNAVRLSWIRYDGIAAMVIERSHDAGSTWTNWTTCSPALTSWVDYGTNAWQTTEFTSLYSLCPAPSVPWGGDAYVPTSRTITINGVVGTLNSNLSFTVGEGADTTFTNYFSFTGPGTFTGDPGSGSNTLIQILSDFTSLGLYPSSNPSNFMTETEANSLFDPIGSAAAVSNAAAATYLKSIIDSDVNMGGNSLTNVNDLTYDSGWRLNDAGTGALQWSFGMALYDVWHSGNDGTGSGLDADLLDGNDSTAFSLDGHNHDTLYDPIGSAAAVSNAAAATYLPAVGGTASNLTINGWVKNTASSGLTIGDASGNSAIDITAAGSGYPAVKWNQGSSMRGRLQYHHAYGSLRFDSGSKYVFSDGNVGIKTESPGYELDVTGRANISSNVIIGGTTKWNSGTNSLQIQFYTASNRWAFVESYGATTNVIFITPAR